MLWRQGPGGHTLPHFSSLPQAQWISVRGQHHPQGAFQSVPSPTEPELEGSLVSATGPTRDSPIWTPVVSPLKNANLQELWVFFFLNVFLCYCGKRAEWYFLYRKFTWKEQATLYNRFWSKWWKYDFDVTLISPNYTALTYSKFLTSLSPFAPYKKNNNTSYIRQLYKSIMKISIILLL